MYNEQPFLEKGGRTYICPQCGGKTLKRYVLGGKHIHDIVGRCNREINCGYHKPPREYWRENNFKPVIKPYVPKQITDMHEIKPIGYISNQYVFDYAKNRYNNLIYYLLGLFDRQTIQRYTDPYFLGSAKSGAVIYWQIDDNGKCRTGKIQKLDKDTGKRIKENGVNWVHGKLKRAGELPHSFNMKMCLFGLHLIRSVNNAGKTVCICESEKSAVIAACCLPQYIWMAAGALHWLNVEKLKPLKGWNIILFPDTSANGKAFELWSKIADEANGAGLNVIVSDMLENQCTDEQKADGFDIADYLIERVLNTKQSIDPQAKAESKQSNVTDSQSDTLKSFINLNPNVRKLIDVFDAVEV